MAYFPANPGWESQRKGEKKELAFRSFPTWPQIENWKKIAKKFKKLENTNMASFSGQNKLGKAEKVRK